MDFPSPSLFRDIGRLVFWVCLQNKSLDVLPPQVILRESFLLLLLALIEFHEEHSNKKVKEEEGANHNEDHKEYHIVKFVFF